MSMIRRTGFPALALSIGAGVISVVTLAVAVGGDSAASGRAEGVTPKSAPADAPRRGHWEVPTDPYVPVPPEARRTSPARRWVRNGFVNVQVNVDAEGNNILGDAANEPSIAVDPNHPHRMVIGWRQFDTIESNFRQAGWGHSHDGGWTWTFPGVIEPGVFRSDPVLDVDSEGYFYYNSLSRDNVFLCHVFKSFDGGVTWDDGVYAYGGDKQWMVIDRTSGVGRNNIYANWTRPGGSCDGQFTCSYDSGYTFKFCVEVPDEPWWGTLAVGPDGELFIGGWNFSTGFFVVRSNTVQDESLPLVWDLVAGVDLGGEYVKGEGPNPGGLLGQSYVAVDQSDGPTRGNVYFLSSVDPPGDDPLDVMFARSTDGGATWSDPIRVNDDPPGTNAWQWFGTMAVASNGRVDVIWADTRADPGGYDSELYYAYSEDAGETWSENVAVSPAFDPHVGWPDQDKIGDYYDMTSDQLGAHVAYSATFNGEQDVYYLRIGAYDCNGNGVPDDEDIANGTSLDCNENGNPDECENLADFDEDGKVDVGDLLLLLGEWGKEESIADLNCDGIVDDADLNYLLGAWPPLLPCPWDLNGDHVVDELDVDIVWEHWGDCPDPPEECPWDLSGDGDVDFEDVAIVEAHFGDCPSAPLAN
jgi:hypothetical protein